MDITFKAIADYANVSQEGKLNVVGIFDTIRTQKFPHTHPFLVFAFRTLFEYTDQERKHHLEVQLIDQDNAVLWGAAAEIEVGPVEPGQFAHTNQVIQLQGITFQKPGRYRFRIQIRGKDKPHDAVFQVVPHKG